MAMPSAPYASAAARPRPSKNPPAPSTGIVGADGVDHLRQQQRRGDRAGVAAALAALGDDGRHPISATFSAWRLAPTVAWGDAGVAEAATCSVGRCASEARHRHPSASMTRCARRCRAGRRSSSRRTGWSVRACTLAMAAAARQRHRGRRQDAEAAGLARRRGQPGARHPPMPVCTIGSRTPNSAEPCGQRI